MMNTGSLQKSLIVMVVLVVAVTCGIGAGIPGKPTECCRKVSSKEITEEVFAFRIAQRHPPCVAAVIFYTKDGYYCAQMRAPWVMEKIVTLKRAAVTRTPTTSSPSS
ncbi:uncharacterized protein LOC144052700 [Vanacampus margaritifer]